MQGKGALMAVTRPAWREIYGEASASWWGGPGGGVGNTWTARGARVLKAGLGLLAQSNQIRIGGDTVLVLVAGVAERGACALWSGCERTNGGKGHFGQKRSLPDDRDAYLGGLVAQPG